MKRLTTLTFALVTAAALATTGCNKRDDSLPPTGAGPGTTTTPSTTDSNTGTAGSMSTSPAMPPASAASQ